MLQTQDIQVQDRSITKWPELNDPDYWLKTSEHWLAHLHACHRSAGDKYRYARWAANALTHWANSLMDEAMEQYDNERMNKMIDNIKF